MCSPVHMASASAKALGLSASRYVHVLIVAVYFVIKNSGIFGEARELDGCCHTKISLH